MRTIRTAGEQDLEFLVAHDRHVSRAELERLIHARRIDVLEDDGVVQGWLRWGMFWNTVPFLNMLFLLETERGIGLGREMLSHWERQRAKEGFRKVMTSTASNELAQHFYVHMGYVAVGGFFPEPGEPYELLFRKELPEYPDKDRE